MKLTASVKEHVESKILHSSNCEFITQYIESQIPDNYDGGFTAEGSYIKDRYTLALLNTLVNIKFLTKDEALDIKNAFCGDS